MKSGCTPSYRLRLTDDRSHSNSMCKYILEWVRAEILQTAKIPAGATIYSTSQTGDLSALSLVISSSLVNAKDIFGMVSRQDKTQISLQL
jgi:hypothetical protein